MRASRAKGPRQRMSGRAGQVVLMVAFSVVALVAMAALAIDLGRLYVVRAELAKAVDGGALAGARVLPLGQGDAEQAALAFADMNFAPGFLGTTAHGFTVAFVQEQNQSLIQVRGTATLPATLMRVVGLDQVPVSAFAEATRRPLEISLVLDTSGSLDRSFNGVDAIGFLRTAADQFVRYFDDSTDKMALVRFASGVTVPFALGNNFTSPITRAIARFTAAGGTNLESALLTGTAQLSRGNPNAFQAIVFFTDGRPTSLRDTFTINGRRVDGVIGGYQDPRVNGGRPPTFLYDPLQVNTQTGNRAPVTLPSGRPATTQNILTETWNRTLAAGSTARAGGLTVFVIGLGNPRAGALEQPDPTLLVALANVQSAPNPLRPGQTIVNRYYNASQPEGGFYFAPDANQLELVFRQVAQEVVVRLTQ